MINDTINLLVTFDENYAGPFLTMLRSLEDEIWNYDTRYFSGYMFRSKGLYTMTWIMQNTVILHFCGKKKPWAEDYIKQFDALYKHYMRLANRDEISGNYHIKDAPYLYEMSIPCEDARPEM